MPSCIATELTDAGLYLQDVKAICWVKKGVPCSWLDAPIHSIQHLFNAAHKQDVHAAAAVCYISLPVKILLAALLPLQHFQQIKQGFVAT